MRDICKKTQFIFCQLLLNLYGCIQAMHLKNQSRCKINNNQSKHNIQDNGFGRFPPRWKNDNRQKCFLITPNSKTIASLYPENILSRRNISISSHIITRSSVPIFLVSFKIINVLIKFGSMEIQHCTFQIKRILIMSQDHFLCIDNTLSQRRIRSLRSHRIPINKKAGNCYLRSISIKCYSRWVKPIYSVITADHQLTISFFPTR